jgi:hypothetical protein
LTVQHLEEVRGVREAAEHRAMTAEDRLSRVRRDYQDRKLEAEDWTVQGKELEAERGAVDAEIDGSMRTRPSLSATPPAWTRRAKRSGY